MSGSKILDKELIETQIEDKRFNEHLEPDFNERIIFSGIFGIGKTFFLDKFFKENEGQYFTVKLNPVNYSVAKNEDIFELIKFDIFLKLLIENPDFEKFDFKIEDYAYLYLKQNWKSFVWELIKLGSSIGLPVTKPITVTLEKLYKKLQEKTSKLNINEEADWLDFKEGIENKQGSIYEFDFISSLLEKTLEQVIIKKKADLGNEMIKSVLIVEDLDRVDPAHIFRLLNVFSAHLDFSDDKPNKFNFDKVVFVCDIKNIRNIFSAFYGNKTDFNGYIDKFYSSEIFEYDFKSILSTNLKIITNQLSAAEDDLYQMITNVDDYPFDFIVSFLSEAITFNFLSTRNLFKTLNRNFKLSAVKLQPLYGGQDYTVQLTPIAFIFEFLIFIFEGEENLAKVMSEMAELKLKALTIGYTYYNNLYGDINMLNYLRNHQFSAKNNINRKYQEKYNFQFRLNLIEGKRKKGIYGYTTNISSPMKDKYSIEYINIWELVADGFDIYRIMRVSNE